jgi:hypothetical protein
VSPLPDTYLLPDLPPSPCRSADTSPSSMSIVTPLLDSDPRSYQLASPTSMPCCRRRLTAPLCGAGWRACAPMTGWAARWGLALLTPTREILASKRIFY